MYETERILSEGSYMLYEIECPTDNIDLIVTATSQINWVISILRTITLHYTMCAYNPGETKTYVIYVCETVRSLEFVTRNVQIKYAEATNKC